MRTSKLTVTRVFFALLGVAAACGDTGTSGNDVPDLAAALPSCTDGIKNGTETDIDCGSTCEVKCSAGKACSAMGDCAAPLLCGSGVCVAPSCMDQVKNQDETDTDCGGAACAKCGTGGACSVNSDCATNTCDNGKCELAATFTAIAPACGPLAGGTAVTLTGTNFVNRPGVGVRFGQIQATAPAVPSATTMTAMTPAATMAGKVDVSIDGQPGSPLSLPMSFQYVAAPAPAVITFGAEQSTGFAPATALAVGDWTGDKNPDFIHDHGGTHLDSGTGSAAGTLTNGMTGISTVAGGPARRMITADLNGDGKMDIIASEGNSISVYLATAAPIGPRVDYAANTTPEGLVAGDFNGDGKVDIAAIHSGVDQISVLLGNGAGVLGAKVDYPAARGTRIATADLDGDTKLDLVATSSLNKEVSVLLGNGNGTFKAKVAYPTTNTTAGLVLGDFNLDGKIDVVTGSGPLLSFLANKGDGTLLASVDTAIPGATTLPVLASADFDANGTPDIIMLNPNSARSEIWLNPCNGRFVTANKNTAIAAPSELVVVDLNNDKKMDLVYSTSGGIRYMLRQ